jgi:arsenate reductase
MRRKEAVYKDLKLDDESLSDDELIGHMVENPVLIERPIVVAGDQVRICRPPELVRELIA